MISVRKALPRDAEAMATLHAQGFDHPWPDTDMKDHIARDIVLCTGEPLNGFLIIRAADDQAELLTITIDPSSRRSGLARQLMGAGEQAAAKAGVFILFLEVAEDNLAAIALYKGLAYQPLGRRPGYYRRAGGRVAALTFRKQLTLDGSPAHV